MELFWEHGYEGTSLSMLTSAMGITPTSLYAAFGSKDALFEEAVELYDSADSSPTVRALELTPTRDAIESMLRRNADAYVDPGTPLGCMVVLAGTNLGRGHEHVGRHLAGRRAKDLARVTERIERGVSDGDLPDGLDAPALASYCVTVLQGLSVRARDGCTRKEAHAVIDVAMAAWDTVVS
ncbi:TetR/AcrR family transcriptional regulator [Nocardiopsis oceani]